MKAPFFIFGLLLCTGVAAQTFTDSDIPIVTINTYNQQIVDDPKITAHFQLFYNGPSVRNYLTDVPEYEGEIGIELRGNYSQVVFPQKPYSFETRDNFGNDLDTSLLGMPSEHDWCLISPYNDKAFSRNTLAFDLWRKMGRWAPQSRFCEVVLNGTYQGIYLLCESIKRDPNRVNIAKLDSTEFLYPNVSGGYIIKNDYWDFTDSWQLNYSPPDHPAMPIRLVYHYPKPDEIPPVQQAYIQAYIDSFETALYSPNFADPVIGYRKYVSELSFVDYFIIQELSRNFDGFMHSFYFYKGKDNGLDPKLHCGPVWDFDWAFENVYISGCPDYSDVNGGGWTYTINDCPAHQVNSVEWHVRMLQDSTFTALLHCRWNELRQTILDTAYINHHIDSVAAYLNEAQQRHYAYWGHIATNVGGCHVFVPTTFAGHVALLKNFIAVRAAWLDANMPGSAVNCGVGISEHNVTQTVIVYPVPAKDVVNVETNGLTGKTSVTIFDQNGRVVLQRVPEYRINYTLNIASLSNGLYTLQISDEAGARVNRKLVIAR